MLAIVTRLATERRGTTALEYGLLAALVSVVMIPAVTALSNGLTHAFSSIAGSL